MPRHAIRVCPDPGRSCSLLSGLCGHRQKQLSICASPASDDAGAAPQSYAHADSPAALLQSQRNPPQPYEPYGGTAQPGPPLPWHVQATQVSSVPVLYKVTLPFKAASPFIAAATETARAAPAAATSAPAITPIPAQKQGAAKRHSVSDNMPRYLV
jgi:hypothetical protein